MKVRIDTDTHFISVSDESSIVDVFMLLESFFEAFNISEKEKAMYKFKNERLLDFEDGGIKLDYNDIIEYKNLRDSTGEFMLNNTYLISTNF